MILSDLVVLCKLTTVSNRDAMHRYITLSGLGLFSLGTDFEALDDAAKDDVFVVEPRSLLVGDEELGAVGVLA